MTTHETKSDPYGSGTPSPLQNPTSLPAGEFVPSPGFPDGGIPAYLKPININTRDLEEVMRGHLNATEPRVQKWLYSTWNANRDAVKYQEIRNALRDGQMDPKWLRAWQEQYAELITNEIAPQWEKTMLTASGELVSTKVAKDLGLETLDVGRTEIRRWIAQRGGELIVNLSERQFKATRLLLEHYTLDNPVSGDELARIIRPTIGLTPKQAGAVQKFRDQLVAEGLPQKTIDHRVGNYTSWLHRIRATRIARTELAFAYNNGIFRTVTQAVDDGILTRPVVKKFQTGRDEDVCPHCGPMHNAIIGLKQTFPGATRKLPNLFMPPLHPSCRCYVDFVVLRAA